MFLACRLISHRVRTSEGCTRTSTALRCPIPDPCQRCNELLSSQPARELCTCSNPLMQRETGDGNNRGWQLLYFRRMLGSMSIPFCVCCSPYGQASFLVAKICPSSEEPFTNPHGHLVQGDQMTVACYQILNKKNPFTARILLTLNIL
jgi:hypothetical protein